MEKSSWADIADEEEERILNYWKKLYLFILKHS